VNIGAEARRKILGQKQNEMNILGIGCRTNREYRVRSRRERKIVGLKQSERRILVRRKMIMEYWVRRIL
jgi:hypothetical protein